ncbi:hypothetical protein B0H16DRAFT_1886898 [Mycena metata]|uniref:Uncharacterized protein n=1 Tax=Mycena metata TaxID=1033252 RepID=A0AAD7J0X7_9AGAR|nr:hypothetical protein B0H16DRAFT_1886895 [Mycena metata]KAJ7753462.1 hypothetical protein B0H16DRAFT_1886898 [Mycena metata]
MVNPTGANGTDNGIFPPDDELKDILWDFERKSLSLELRLQYLQKKHHIKIGLTKLKALNRQFNVPSARKFRAVEQATGAIADIISRDVYQGQGPDTVKKIASLRLNLTIPRDFVRATMKGLVGQKPSDMRRPGRGKGPKIRTALNAIGIFQEIHVDGHEKLGEKALRMGSGIGIDIYGMRDHVGKILQFNVVPNSRLSDAVGHLFLDMVSKFQAISVQVTFNGGSELGWLAAFQTTLREVFAPDLSTDEWRPVVAVKSTSNITIESAWSYDRQFNGRTLRAIIEEGHEFVDYFNNKKTRRQRNRILPSGVAPNVVFDMPANYGLENLAIPVTQAALDELRGLIDTPRKEAFRWVSDEFEAVATEVYIGIGSPKLEALSGWTIFNDMAPVLREVVDLAQL